MKSSRAATLSGHWFCKHCDDVVHYMAGAAGTSPPRCPFGSRHKVVWVSHQPRPVSDETERQRFEHMRQIVNAALDAIPK